MLLIPCKNRGLSRCVPCVVSPKQFKHIKPDTEIICKLVLMLGVSFTQDTSIFPFNYVEWNNNKHGYASLKDAMEQLKHTDRFMKTMVDTEIIASPVKTLMFVF